MSQFSIRRLTVEDAERFREIRLEALQRHPEAFGADFDDEMQQTLTWFADRLTSSYVFGGFDENRELLGVVAVACGNAVKTRHNASLWGMYVRPTARGTGLSRSLLDRATEEALRQCRSVRLGVVTTNHAAQRLYSAAGFRKWAIDVDALFVGGVFYDEILMRLDRA
jgi:RimJ/RimL family protein N-acetyltransferase